MKCTSIAIAGIFLWAPLFSIAITGCDSKEIYDAKIEKYSMMYCAGAWPENNRLPKPDCDARRGVDKSKTRYYH